MGRSPLVDKEIVSEEKDKPVLDEQTLGKLLEAAYVLQEHNREVQEMELDLSLKRDQIEAEERSVPTRSKARRRRKNRVDHATPITRSPWQKSSKPSTRFKFVICSRKVRCRSWLSG